MVDTQFARQMKDWRLVTAEILYGMPDHPHILQTFIHQVLDLPPSFPELGKFLSFWQAEIEGPIRSVRVATSGLIKPAEMVFCKGIWTLQ